MQQQLAQILVGAGVLLLFASITVHAFPTTPTTRNYLQRGGVGLSSSHQLLANKKNVVIVGGGLGGLSSAFDASHYLQNCDADITVVSNQPHFSFVPSNPWIALGKRKPQDIQVSLNKVLPKHQIEFVHHSVVQLSPDQNQITLDDDTTISYDYLIIATGPKLGLDVVPGLAEYGVSICTTPHAVQAYEKFQQLVQNPGPVVVGATQGASCFGPAYEYLLLLQHELYQWGGPKLVDACPMTFVTSEPYIGHLGLHGVGDSRRILEQRMKNVRCLVNASVQEVTKHGVVIVNDQDEVETIPSQLTMMIPAFFGHNAWKNVKGLTDSKGMILTNSHMQSVRYPNIFGVGICVHLDPIDTSTKVPIGVPKTGYMIESMGTAAVLNIRDLMHHRPIHTTPQLNGVCITDFGNDGAIF
ncbi:hypothetical protein ACA910_010105 [Epithemia clementina (nom. ined.)]